MKKFIIANIVVIVLLIVFLPSFARIQDMKEKLRQDEKQINDLKRQNARLNLELKRLRSDPAYLEEVARDKMGVAKEGEVIYKIKPIDPEQKGR
ncbi:MAG: septum formation initiator family protein [Candidatus Omnitrophica bacterium]|nr:septum formation initiator family protein [Candidatus Omnitrophota bacterium]